MDIASKQLAATASDAGPTVHELFTAAKEVYMGASAFVIVDKVMMGWAAEDPGVQERIKDLLTEGTWPTCLLSVVLWPSIPLCSEADIARHSRPTTVL